MCSHFSDVVLSASCQLFPVVRLFHRVATLRDCLEAFTRNGVATAVGQAIGAVLDLLQRAVDRGQAGFAMGEDRFIVGLLGEAVAVVAFVLRFAACRRLPALFVHAGGIARCDQLLAQIQEALLLFGDEGVIELGVGHGVVLQ